jgi:ATP-binding cassette subfamily B protein
VRRQFGVVLQDPYLFTGTIEDNIRLGTDAIRREQVEEAAGARALAHNPRCLILDEATSSVDTETEFRVREALDRMVDGV